MSVDAISLDNDNTRRRWYVERTENGGDDANDGTSSHPLANPATAMYRAAIGDTIVCGSGISPVLESVKPGVAVVSRMSGLS